jgi:ribosomal protein L22
VSLVESKPIELDDVQDTASRGYLVDDTERDSDAHFDPAILSKIMEVKSMHQSDVASINSANDEFVHGLDDFHKFLEEVDPPDELDVGASGYSIQEILMGQGTKIAKARIRRGIHHLNELRLKIINAITGNRDDESFYIDSDDETMALSRIENDGQNPFIAILREPKDHAQRLMNILEHAISNAEKTVQNLINKIRMNKEETFDDDDEASFDREIAEIKRMLDENRKSQRRAVSESTITDDLVDDFEAVG